RCCPSVWLRLSVIDFLFRETTFHQIDWPPTKGAHDRRGSPPLGCSTLITCAPRSASREVAVPPETIVERSRTVRSVSGPVGVDIGASGSRATYVTSVHPRLSLLVDAARGRHRLDGQETRHSRAQACAASCGGRRRQSPAAARRPGDLRTAPGSQ